MATCFSSDPLAKIKNECILIDKLNPGGIPAGLVQHSTFLTPKEQHIQKNLKQKSGKSLQLLFTSGFHINRRFLVCRRKKERQKEGKRERKKKVFETAFFMFYPAGQKMYRM